jgi:hypothetical protein
VFRPAPKCPQCGHVPEIKAREIEVVEGTLQEVRKIESAQRRQQVGRAQSFEELVRLGVERGYKNPSFWARKVMDGRGRKAA